MVGISCGVLNGLCFLGHRKTRCLHYKTKQTKNTDNKTLKSYYYDNIVIMYFGVTELEKKNSLGQKFNLLTEEQPNISIR